MVRGKMIMRLYDDKGNITEEFLMAPLLNSLNALNSSNPTVPMVQVELGQWHSLEVLEEGTVVFEAKDGAYEPIKEDDVMKR